MDPFESYKLYNALKLHFEGSYDAVKYNFKTNTSPNSFFKSACNSRIKSAKSRPRVFSVFPLLCVVASTKL